MPTPNPRYGSRKTRTNLQNPPGSRWTARRKALAALTPAGPPTPPTYDLVVTGTLSPDVAGGYNENGTYAGQPAYQRADGAYWISSGAFGAWYLAEHQGAVGDPAYWYAGAGPTGTFNPFGSATGVATVAAP